MNNKTKKALKGIVKECLIEILAEGLIGNNQATLSEARELKGALYEAQQASTKPSTNFAGTSRQPTKNPKFNDKVNETVSKITKDSLMSELLADTANTTLLEQGSGNVAQSTAAIMASGDSASKIVDQSSPDQLFGESSSNWANLAFAPSIRK